jgi:eukaryotic-like serine/threonine-protein kinase
MHSPDRIGRYEIITPLGPGRHLARARGVEGFERHVEIATIAAGEEPAATRFAESARLLAMHHHQHVAVLLELGSEGDQMYLVREYIHGRTLAELWQDAVERESPLPYDFALTVCMAAASALAQVAAPRVGSMDNLAIGYDGAVKLTALGVGRAPEHVLGEVGDLRTDVFALGTLLYELTTMRRAFHDPSERITLERLRSATYNAPTKVVPGYPRALERVVARALQLAPEARFADATALHRELAIVARRLQLVVGGAAVSEVMTQLYEDTRVPWARSAIGVEMDDEQTTTAPPPRRTPSRGSVRSLTEAVDALVSDRDADDGDDNAAATRELRASVVLGAPRPESQFSSGEVTALADHNGESAGDPTAPTPRIDPIELADAQEGTQITAVPPPPPASNVPPRITGPSAQRSVQGSLPPTMVEPLTASRLADTIPPTDRALLGLTDETPPPLEPAPPLPTAPGVGPAPVPVAPSGPIPIAPTAPSGRIPVPPAGAPPRRPPVLPPAPPRVGPVGQRRALLFVAVSVGTVLGVAAVVIVLLLSGDHQSSPPGAPAPVVTSAPMPAAPPDAAAKRAMLPPVAVDAAVVPGGDAAPATVQLQITSVPSGATVLLDGKRLGHTPYDEPVAADSAKHTLKLRKTGYNSVHVEIELTSNVRRDIELVAAPAEEPDEHPLGTGPAPDAAPEATDAASP